MSVATWLTGDVFDRLAEIDDQSVHSVITSPPYWRQRSYLPAEHPDNGKEIGQEPSPGEYLAALLRLTDHLHRVLRDDGTIWINLGDTISGSGGWGSDVDSGGGQRWVGTMPPAKAVCWIPQIFGASLAYGRNLLTGEPCRQWVTRPPVTWCKPSVTPGRCDDRFRRATELIVWASKGPRYYWDKASILEPLAESPGNRYLRKMSPADKAMRRQGAGTANTFTADQTEKLEGTPPFDWWVIATSGYDCAHFATFPPALILRPVIVSCPPGGTILDPFGGSGTVASVATGNGRNCISIDIDERNLDLARARIGMFLHEPEPA